MLVAYLTDDFKISYQERFALSAYLTGDSSITVFILYYIKISIYKLLHLR